MTTADRVSPSPSSTTGAPLTTQIPDAVIQTALNNTYTKHKNNQDGKNVFYIKALAEVDSKLFWITIVTADGRFFDFGNTQSKFPIQSISNVVTYAKIMQENGPKVEKEKIGVNPTGLPFNSIIAIELIPTRSVNPFVDPSAIASTSLAMANDSDSRRASIKANMDAFAAHKIEFNEVVYDSEVNDNLRNQAISKLLQTNARTYSDPLEATTVYTKQCSVDIISNDLAVMGSVLANGGMNPISGEKVIDAENTPYILAVMATAELYDNTGIAYLAAQYDNGLHDAQIWGYYTQDLYTILFAQYDFTQKTSSGFSYDIGVQFIGFKETGNLAGHDTTTIDYGIYSARFDGTFANRITFATGIAKYSDGKGQGATLGAWGGYPYFANGMIFHFFEAESLRNAASYRIQGRYAFSTIGIDTLSLAARYTYFDPYPEYSISSTGEKQDSMEIIGFSVAYDFLNSGYRSAKYEHQDTDEEPGTFALRLIGGGSHLII